MKWELRWYDSIWVIVFFYLFFLQIQAIWPFTIDDMYISLRYAKNWAAGNGLLWNVFAPPVEGYSNFSFVVLATITLLLNGDPVIVLKIAGVFGLFFTTYFLYLLTRFWFPQRVSLLPCVALLFYRGQIIWTASGLETAVYEALICATVYFCFRGMGYRPTPLAQVSPKLNFFISAGLCMVLAGMTRPEASALMILFFLLLCWNKPGRRVELHLYRKGIFLFAATIALFFIPYFAWRFFYFGYLFPNSVYCKGLLTVFNIALDIKYLQLAWLFLLFSLPACVVATDRRHYFLWLPSMVYLLMLINSEPIVAFDNRLFLPAFALLLPLALQGMDILLFTYWPKKENIFYFCLSLFFLGTVFFFIPGMTLDGYRYFSQNPLKGEQLRSKVINWLKIHGKNGQSVILADSGMIPYSSNLNFVDSYCLNNIQMAHYSPVTRYERFCEQVMKEKPAIIILTSLIDHGRVIYTPSDQCLKIKLEKQNEYKLVHFFTSDDSQSTYRYEIFVGPR